MYYQIAAKFLVLLSLFTQINFCKEKKEIVMSDKVLGFAVSCRDNPGCRFKGENVFLDIKITNIQKVDVGFPLQFAKDKGPGVKLIDTETKKESYLSTHLADWALKDEFTIIKPGDSVSMEWVITADELRQFGHSKVDLTAEITVIEQVRVGGKLVEFRGVAPVRIITDDTPKETEPASPIADASP